MERNGFETILGYTDLFFSTPELILVSGIFIICGFYVAVAGSGPRTSLFPIFRSIVLITLFSYSYLGSYQIMFGSDTAYGFIWNSFFWLDKGVFVTKVVFSYVTFCITYSYLHSKSIKANSQKHLGLDSKIFEFVLLILLMLLGMIVCLSSNSLIVFYLGLELQSFCIFILLFINAQTPTAVQSSITYFLSVLVSSLLFLVGIVYLYYRFGSFDLSDIWLCIYTMGEYREAFNYFDYIGIFLLMLGLFVKVGLFPVHLWVPEVYTYSEIFPVSLIATISKLFGLAVLIHIFVVCSSQSGVYLFIGLLSVGAIAHGVIAGLTQTRVLSLLGYSAIAHMGYVFLVLSLNTPDAFAYAFIYIIIYLFNLLPVLLFIMTVRWVSYDGINSDSKLFKISDFTKVKCKSLSDIATLLFISTFFFSFIGVPPFSGFFAKYYLIALLIHSNQFFEAFILLAFSVISAAYYLKVIKSMLLDSSIETKILERDRLVTNFWHVPMQTKIVVLIYGILNICAVFIVPFLMVSVYYMF